MNEREITITTERDIQYVYANGLGRFLMRPEVDEIVSSFGSQPNHTNSGMSLEIIPPIKRKRALGNALVKLAKQLDKDSPRPALDFKDKVSK